MKVVVRLKTGAVAKFNFEDPSGEVQTVEQVLAFVKDQVPDAQTILVRVK